MLVGQDPGNALKYPCYIFMMMYENNKVLDGFIYQPDEFRQDGHNAYRFILGGCFWVYFVSSHTHMLKHNEIILSEEGTLLMPIRKAEDTDLFQKLSQEFIKQKKLV